MVCLKATSDDVRVKARTKKFSTAPEDRRFLIIPIMGGGFVLVLVPGASHSHPSNQERNQRP